MDSRIRNDLVTDQKGEPVSYRVRILLIEGDKAFQNELCDSVRNGADDAQYHIETCDGCCIASKGQCDTNGHFDIYICGNPPDHSCSVLDLIKAVKQRDPGATIFVISDAGDPALLKKIMKMNVEGLIDRDILDLTPLLREIKTISETYVKVSNMVQKLNRLSALKSVG